MRKSRKSDAVSLDEFIESSQPTHKESVIDMPRKKGVEYWGDSKDDYWIHAEGKTTVNKK
jgi:hypothetical protein